MSYDDVRQLGVMEDEYENAKELVGCSVIDFDQGYS